MCDGTPEDRLRLSVLANSNPFFPPHTCRDACPAKPPNCTDNADLYYAFYHALNNPCLSGLRCEYAYDKVVQAPYLDPSCPNDFPNRADWQNLSGCSQRSTMQTLTLVPPSGTPSGGVAATYPFAPYPSGCR